MKTKNQLKYVHYSIEIRSSLIDTYQTADYDGQIIEISLADPYYPTFKEGHKESLAPGIEYSFIDDYVHMLPNWHLRKMTKIERKKWESGYRKYYFDTNK